MAGVSKLPGDEEGWRSGCGCCVGLLFATTLHRGFVIPVVSNDLASLFRDTSRFSSTSEFRVNEQGNRMPDQRDVAVIVGSLRKASWTRLLARAFIGMAPPSLKMEIVEIGDLALYNQDFDDEQRVPASWSAFRTRMSRAEAVLFVTPEYNRSVPGVLKNAIDVGSRPYGKSAWNGKPAAVVSNSPGALSGFGANHHLRQSLVFLNMPTLQQPEAYVGGVNKLVDAEGNITNAETKKFLEGFLVTFAGWIEKVR
jgi:chromate reductase